MRRTRGFTLIELLVALAILAIISALAIPIYTQYSVRTYRADAMKDLLLCGQGLERLASQTFTYAGQVDTNADGIGDADTGPVSANICTPSSFNYAITVQVANANAFTVRAVPTNGPVVGDGGLEADASGARRWDKNNNANYAEAGEDDWKN
jgi:type IV pilus assembly protein PilE